LNAEINPDGNEDNGISVSSVLGMWLGNYLVAKGYLAPGEFARLIAEARQRGLSPQEVVMALLETTTRRGLRISDIYAGLSFGRSQNFENIALSGISLSDYYLGLLFGNEIINSLKTQLKDLSRVGRFNDITGWEQFWEMYSPQAIIREILKKLNPDRITRQTAKLRLVFPKDISPAQLMVILLSIIVFAISLGYSAARYHLTRRKEILIPVSK
jgi:hypothetical protein